MLCEALHVYLVAVWSELSACINAESMCRDHQQILHSQLGPTLRHLCSVVRSFAHFRTLKGGEYQIQLYYILSVCQLVNPDITVSSISTSVAQYCTVLYWDKKSTIIGYRFLLTTVYRPLFYCAVLYCIPLFYSIALYCIVFLLLCIVSYCVLMSTEHNQSIRIALSYRGSLHVEMYHCSDPSVQNDVW